MWGQLRQVQQQQQQQQQHEAGAAASNSAPTSAPTSATTAAADYSNSNASASASETSAPAAQQLPQQLQQPDASCSAKTMRHSNVNAKNMEINNNASRDTDIDDSGRKHRDAAAASDAAGTADDGDDDQQQWGFDDDPFFADDGDFDDTTNNGNGDQEQPKPMKQNQDKEVSPDKSGKRRQFTSLKTKHETTASNTVESKSKQQPIPNNRRRSSLLSINEDTSLMNEDGGDNGSSWPAMIDFESNNANSAGEFADASDNFNDSSRSLGSTSRASMEEKRKLDRDLALIRNEQKVDAKSMNMVNKTVAVVMPADTRSKSKDTPGKTPKAKNSIKAVVDDHDDLADNDTAAAIVGGGGVGIGGRGGTTGMQTRSQTQKQAAKEIAANEHAEEEDDELIPPSSTASSRRLGASAGTRSAVKKAAQTQKQKQKAKEEMKLAERKFAAAVQKITADNDDDNDNFGDNWDFEDDDAGNEDSANDNAAGTLTTTSPGSDLHGKLVQYLASLSGVDTPLVQSLNSLLQAELNTDENCDELMHYYTARPQLLEYTIETELSRMDYLVITPYDQYVDKEEIKLYVESTSDQRDSTENLIWRASNQSLLADLLAALTGDDRLIRPSMMVTAVAESCKFELNLVGGDGSNRGVAVMSDLLLSIPFADAVEGESSRLELGKVKARVLFVPKLQQLEYSIVQATALISPHDELLVAAAAALERNLAELGIGEAAMAQGPHVDQLSRTAHDELRDQFLATVSTGASGLSSALREFDSVTNVSGKLGWLKAAMPSLPTADVIAQAESEATSVHGAPTTHHQGSFPRPSPSNMNANRGHGFLDRLADEGQPSVSSSRSPPQPGARAMGFLDRLVNELEAPDQQQSQFPRPTPAPAPTGTNTNHFDDKERFPRPPVQAGQPAPPSPAPAPAAGKAPLIGGFLVRGLANAAKGLAEAAVAADEFAEAQYARPSQQKDEQVKFYRQPNDDHSDQKLRGSDVPPPQHDVLETNRVDASSGGMGHAGDAYAHTNALNLSEGDNIVDDSGGWSDDDDIDIDHDEATVQNSPAAKPDQPIKADDAHPPSEPKAEPSFRSFADRLSEAAEGSMAPVSSTAAPESEKLSRPFQNMTPASTAAPASIGGASVSTCDGSYQFVSMKSLQDELPEPKDWLAVEAVDAVDGDGIIPTRTRWRPRRARA